MTSPIQLTEGQVRVIEEWAPDAHLWGDTPARRHNLTTFARAILKEVEPEKPRPDARACYNAYYVSVGYREVVSRNPLPAWDRICELAESGDADMQKVKAGWEAVAAA